jgi:hypothetical protein
VRRSILWLAAAVALLAAAAPAFATPAATNDATYTVLGRVFPDPLGGCQLAANTAPCSPHAQGNVPATQFIQWDEFVSGLQYLNSKPGWQRHMEVLVLDGKIGAGSGTAPGPAMFPGNNLSSLEFTPKPEYVSAGLPTTTLDRKVSDLVVVRVTDESVPDKGKKRYTLALSIHGIERAGVEGGTRAIEDLVTAFTTGKHDDPIVPAAVRQGAPTFADVLKKTIIYFAFPNPDGWRRGSISEGGVFFQRYNGNGVDLNRDWPDIGFSFRPYSGVSEPETRALFDFYRGVEKTTKARFAAGDDLHGQLGADALSYTMLPHGRHDLAKDKRLLEVAKLINRGTYELTKWSELIQDNDQPVGRCVNAPVVGTAACAPMYAQTFGTVYDTINYTTTGTLGDWFDSTVGLNSDGIDNEMSFSHLDRNIVFDPQGEQLHVDGNKALIYAHLVGILSPTPAPVFDAPGTKGYVANARLVRAEQVNQGDAPKKTVTQDPYLGLTGVADPAAGGFTSIPFKVFRTREKGGGGIYNGGMRVQATTTNIGGIGTGVVILKVQCKGCDDHAGVPEEEDWITVAEDFNQSPLYAQAGITVAVNQPQGSAEGVQWRALISEGSLATKVDVIFTSGPATSDGATEGDEPPRLAAYNVANTDFVADLNKYIPDTARKFQAISPRAVIDGSQSLAGYNSLVLADDALPGYVGLYAGESPRPTGPPTADLAFEEQKVTTPGQGPEGCVRDPATTTDQHDFSIGPNDANEKMVVQVRWRSTLNDWDIYLQKKNASGTYEDVPDRAGTNFATTSEGFEVPLPEPGDYRLEVVNCSATDPNYSGRVDFVPMQPLPAPTFTEAEKNVWIAKLREWVQAGGNLVLTDGALRALGDLTGNAALAGRQQTVYAGQIAFTTGTGDTLAHPLASGVAMRGARFNTGMRRQMYEPTPLGFSIQSFTGTDSAGARQYDVARTAWEAAGGTIAATSANSGARNAQAVTTRVTLGELRLGAGTIRVVGALLPQPSTVHDHPLGVEPYAVTYTGYIVFGNLLTR